MTYTIKDKVECLEREVKLRKRLYPGRIEHRRMTKKAADREIAIMSEILAEYLNLLKQEDLFSEGG